jgi:hypothetical protein
MTLDEFRELAESWGADIARWPEHVRVSAAELGRQPEAMAILADADRFDRLISVAKPNVLADRVDAAIFNVVTRVAADSRPVGSHRVSLRPRWLIPAASFATAAVLGVSLGLMKPLNTLRSLNDTATLTIILDTGSFGPDWMLE